jgi:ferredoxin-NADP reductase
MRFHTEWTPARIERTADITPTIRLFEIAPQGLTRSWSPGAHMQVQVQVDGRDETRTYSLIDLGGQDHRYRIAVKRMDDRMGGSRHMWSLKADDPLTISQPHNQFELSLNAPSFTLVAGGVGITPLVSMARTLSHGDKPVHLHYAVRSPEEAAFASELKAWLGDRLSLYVRSEGRRMDLATIVADIPADGELYVCGPIGMLEAVRELWAENDRNIGLLRYETFATGGHHANQEFSVAIPRLGIELQVPAHQTLLSALEQAGVDMLSDCRRGECGLCAVDVLGCDAPIDHRDVFFSQHQKAANKKLCACVSRPAGGRLEIDTAYRGQAGSKAP